MRGKALLYGIRCHVFWYGKCPRSFITKSYLILKGRSWPLDGVDMRTYEEVNEQLIKRCAPPKSDPCTKPSDVRFIYWCVPARRGLQQTAPAAIRHDLIHVKQLTIIKLDNYLDIKI